MVILTRDWFWAQSVGEYFRNLQRDAEITEGFCLLLEKGLARTVGAGPSNILAGILHFRRGYRFPSLNATSKHTWITQAYVMDAFFWSFLVFVATSKYV